ncbi:hypothetical protein BO82DRAFT_41677 [Aspergillus uvarum CBS 121591]|uniref:Uncharacterized protein n=1 Tax=Aspergillus uvarum CBS 121591 TaxID=1448315 RepID=A0A319CC75_9EURO|nr:hypothetical protein BO82DRAFT_41677 [Aspergillus uvarum CBS 121591]PYH83466.1 hypothetical protein BO82DRAFT_41677 [Aspergillus uvarum CBS 121591]
MPFFLFTCLLSSCSLIYSSLLLHLLFPVKFDSQRLVVSDGTVLPNFRGSFFEFSYSGLICSLGHQMQLTFRVPPKRLGSARSSSSPGSSPSQHQP